MFLFLLSLLAMVIGVIKPTVFSKMFKGNVSRKRLFFIFGSATLIFFIIAIATTPKNLQVENTQQDKQITKEETKAETKQEAKPESEIESTKTEEQTPTETKQVGDQNITATPSETVSQKNAVAKAKTYLAYSAFSHDGLVNQLEYEHFSHVDAVYGADNSGANWNEQADKKAKTYMEYSAFSRISLIEQLKHEKFTQEQAEHGADAVGL